METESRREGVMFSRDDDWVLQLLECGDEFVDVGLCMGCGDLAAEAGVAFGHDGISKTDDEDP